MSKCSDLFKEVIERIKLLLKILFSHMRIIMEDQDDYTVKYIIIQEKLFIHTDKLLNKVELF